MFKKIIIFIFILLTSFVYSQDSVNIEGAKYSIEILNKNVNNHYSNFGTTFYGDDKIVFASPIKKRYIIKNNWKGNHQPFLDLYIGDITDNGQLENVTKFSKNLNTRYHEADVTFTEDKRTVYFTRNNYFENKYTKDSTGMNLLQLYRANITESGEWENIEPMPFNSDQYQTGHPTLSSDERTLYFISDMPGTLGKTDIFKTTIAQDGTIGEPINMGPKVNTAEREMFSSISGNDELYFSSDGREDGLGGLDIYVTKIQKDGSLSAIQNLGTPINSEKDDFSFIINYETRRGYFSSNRGGGHGDDDIYTFVQELPLVIECSQVAQGVVINKNTGKILPDALVILYDNKGTELNRMIVGDDARFSFGELTCNESYKVVGSKEQYSTDSEEFLATEDQKLELELALETIKNESFEMSNGKCVVKINPIYFDFDKSNIRQDAEVELYKVISVMQKYPELIIEGGSHTDSRGSSKYNDGLSSRRAKSTVDFIIRKGLIPSNRISSRGYGERELVNGCADGVRCSEEEHQFNRRTEFVIVNYDQIKSKYPEICLVRATSTKEQIEQGVKINIDAKKDGYIKGGQDNTGTTSDELIKKERERKSFNSIFETTANGNILIRINPVYFDLNSSNIRKDAIVQLDKVVDVMYRYPELIIEGGSHTDSRASDSYNNNLSDSRAKSTVNYIISRGINPNRITAKGYGETQLKNHCSDGVKCNNDEHQENRRTEFKILNPEVINR